MNNVERKEEHQTAANINKDIKCVVWDLDNTIWSGILSEGDKVTLFPEIKKVLEELDSRGILHSVCSRNDYQDVMKKLRSLGIDQYFLYPQINWGAKSQSIEVIQKALNIGMDTILFIDDQMYELDEVRSVHPTINCMHASFYKSLLTDARLMPKFITEDSKRRRFLYLEDMKRKHDESLFTGTSDEFLKTLQMQFIISEATENCLQRAEELTVRTNQLNSTGCTYSYDELNHFRTSADYKLLVCELVDKYGSYGKIGLALIHMTEKVWHIKLLIMSCRVISRGVGTVLLSYIMQEAKKNDKVLIADFKKTERNKMMDITYRFAGFKNKEVLDNDVIVLENDLSNIQQFPVYIDVVIK